MLPFARRELVVCMDLNQCDSVCAALDQAKIPYTVKSRDRSSPFVFAMGTRERTGTFGQPASWTYTVYVKPRDWEGAQALLRRPAR